MSLETVEANLSTSLRLLQELEEAGECGSSCGAETDRRGIEAGLPASYQVEFIEQRRRSAAFLGQRSDLSV